MRNLTLVCAALAIAGSVVAGTLWRELRVERQRNEELLAQLPPSPSPERTLASPVPASLKAAPAEPAAAQPRITAPPPTKSEAAPLPAVAALSARMQDEKALLEDPEYRAARLLQTRLTLPTLHPGLAEALGLSATEADAFFGLLAEHQLESSAIALPFPAPGPDGRVDQQAVSEALRARQELQQQHDAAIAAHLGPAKLQAYRDYQQTRPARSSLQSLQRAFNGEGRPLTEAQQRALLPVFVEAQKRQQELIQSALRREFSGGPPASPVAMQEVMLGAEEESNRLLLEAAGQHLDAQQLEILRNSLAQQSAMTRASRRAIEAQQQLQPARPDGAAAGVQP